MSRAKKLSEPQLMLLISVAAGKVVYGRKPRLINWEKPVRLDTYTALQNAGLIQMIPGELFPYPVKLTELGHSVVRQLTMLENDDEH